LNGAAIAHKRARGHDVLAAAVTIESQRLNGRQLPLLPAAPAPTRRSTQETEAAASQYLETHPGPLAIADLTRHLQRSISTVRKLLIARHYRPVGIGTGAKWHPPATVNGTTAAAISEATPTKQLKGLGATAERRQRTRTFLATFSETEPRPYDRATFGSISQLKAQGYLKEAGTDSQQQPLYLLGKPYHPEGDPGIAKPATGTIREKLQRFLWRFSTSGKPRLLTSQLPDAYDVLVRDGYLKAKGNGYVRTGKVFMLTPE